MKQLELTPFEKTFLNATKLLVADGMTEKNAKQEVIRMMHFILDKMEDKVRKNQIK